MIRTTTLVLAALVPVLASAQLGTARGAVKTADDANARIQRQADAATATGVEAPPKADPGAAGRAEGSATSPDQGRAAVPPPDTYTVRPGDTLWDLSGRFLNNPWYWPKVWSFNPDLSNPHWIEPGNVLKFYPSTEEGPARIEPVPEAAKAPTGVAVGPEVEEPADVEAPKELEGFSKADMKTPIPAEQQEEVNVVGPYKVGYVAPRTLMARRDTFVTPRQVEESGTIVAAFEEKLMLATFDRAYAHFKTGNPSAKGETYVVYKTERPIRHPVTGDLVGYQTRILGTARVVAVDAKSSTLVIGQTLEPIERGALLGPWSERYLRPVTPRPATHEVTGRILGSPVELATQLGEHQVVFIDRGKKDGVEEGNVFKVLRSGDAYGVAAGEIQYDPDLPLEVVGELLVIDVKETTATALVSRSLRELALGDRIRMQVPGGAGGN